MPDIFTDSDVGLDAEVAQPQILTDADVGLEEVTPEAIRSAQIGQRIEEARLESERQLAKAKWAQAGENIVRAVSPLHAVGSILNWAGERITGPATEDVLAGQFLPPKPGEPFMPRLLRGPQQEVLPPPNLGPFEKGVVGMAKTIPVIAAGTALTAMGAPTPLAFGTVMGAETAARGGTPEEIILSGVTGAAIPESGALGKDLAAKVLASAVGRGFLSANRTLAQKAIEEFASQGGMQLFMAGLNIPEYAAAPPEKRLDLIKERATENAAWFIPGLFGLMRPGGGGPSETQREVSPLSIAAAAMADSVKDPTRLKLIRDQIDRHVRDQTMPIPVWWKAEGNPPAADQFLAGVETRNIPIQVSARVRPTQPYVPPSPGGLEPFPFDAPEVVEYNGYQYTKRGGRWYEPSGRLLIPVGSESDQARYINELERRLLEARLRGTQQPPPEGMPPLPTEPVPPKPPPKPPPGGGAGAAVVIPPFVPQPPIPEKGPSYAIDTGQKPESRQPQYIGTPPGENVPPNAPQVREGEGQRPSGGNRPGRGGPVPPVEEAPTPAQPVEPPPVPFDPPQFPTRARTGDAKADFAADKAAREKWDADLAAWEKQQPANKAILFQFDNRVVAVTPNVGKPGWRATNFNAKDRLVTGHMEYDDRIQAIREQVISGGKRIEKMPFEVEPVPTGMFPGDIVVWSAPNGEKVEVNFRGFLGGADSGKAVVFDEKTGVQQTVNAMDLRRKTDLAGPSPEPTIPPAAPGTGTVPSGPAGLATEGGKAPTMAPVEKPSAEPSSVTAEPGESPGRSAAAIKRDISDAKNELIRLAMINKRLGKLGDAKGRKSREARIEKLKENLRNLRGELSRVETEKAPTAPKPVNLKGGITEADGLLFDIVNQGKVPVFMPPGIVMANYLRLKALTIRTPAQVEAFNKILETFPRNFEDDFGPRGETARAAYEAAKKAGIADELFVKVTDGSKIKLDTMLDSLRRATGKQLSAIDLYSEIERLAKAHEARARGEAGVGAESEQLATEEKQLVTFQRDNDAKTKDTTVLVPDNLQVGTEFKLQGTKLKVVSIETDEDGRVVSVTLDDGNKYGTQRVTLEDGTVQLRMDIGSLKQPKGAETATDFLGEEGKEPTAPKEPWQMTAEEAVKVVGLTWDKWLDDVGNAERNGRLKPGDPAVKSAAATGYQDWVKLKSATQKAGAPKAVEPELPVAPPAKPADEWASEQADLEKKAAGVIAALRKVEPLTGEKPHEGSGIATGRGGGLWSEALDGKFTQAELDAARRWLIRTGYSDTRLLRAIEGAQVKPAEAPPAPPKPKVTPRPLTKAEQAEFEELTWIFKNYRDKNGPAPTTEQTQRYEYLTALAGQVDLLAEPQADNITAIKGRIAELEAKEREMYRLRMRTFERLNESRVQERREQLAKEAGQYDVLRKEAKAQIEKLKRQLAEAEGPKPEVPPPAGKPDVERIQQEIKQLDSEIELLQQDYESKMARNRRKAARDIIERINELDARRRMLRSDLTEGRGEIVLKTPVAENENTGEMESREYRLRQFTSQEFMDYIQSPEQRMREFGNVYEPWAAESRRVYYSDDGKTIVRRDPWYLEALQKTREEAIEKAASYSGTSAKDWKRIQETLRQPPLPKAAEKPPEKPFSLSNLSESDQNSAADLWSKLRKKSEGPPIPPGPAPAEPVGGRPPIEPSGPERPPLDDDSLLILSKLGRLYVKSGVKRFPDFAAKIKADAPDMWDSVKRYLRGTWLTVAGENAELEDVTLADARAAIAALDRPAEVKPPEPPPVEAKPPQAPKAEAVTGEAKAEALFAQHEAATESFYGPEKTRIRQEIGDAFAPEVRLGDREDIGSAYIAYRRADATRQQFEKVIADIRERLKDRTPEGEETKVGRIKRQIANLQFRMEEDRKAGRSKIADEQTLRGLQNELANELDRERREKMLAPPPPKPPAVQERSIPVPFGKYAGKQTSYIADVDIDYALWMAKTFKDDRNQRKRFIAEALLSNPKVIAALDRAKAGPQAMVGMTERLADLKPQLTEYGLTAGMRGNEILLTGETFDVKEIIKNFGGRWNQDAQGWTFADRTRFQDFLSDLERRRATTAGRLRGPVRFSAEGLRLAGIRDGIERGPDESVLEGGPGQFVSDPTANLLRAGERAGIPPEVINEQIEDAARIVRARDIKKPIIILASDAGAGKTFVLGAAIREMFNRGAQTIVYVTMNQNLIEQIKADLKPYGIADRVKFMTYKELREAAVRPTDVIIFDEAHNIKNVLRARQGERGQKWIANSKYTVFSTATPFENPTDAGYMEATGVFDVFGGFQNFAVAYGSVAIKSKDGTKTWLLWKRDKESNWHQVSARKFFIKQGMFVQRLLRIDPKMTSVQMVKTEAEPKWTKLYSDLENSAAEVAQMNGLEKLPGMDQAWLVGYQKRILEASKVKDGIARAKEALARGRSVVLFVETKAERIIDIPDRIRRWEDWQEAVREALAMGERPPPPSAYGALSTLLTEMLRTMQRRGYDKITIESAEDVITDALGENNVAIYTGSVSDAKARDNLAEWRAMKKRVLVATMAKGGTGLSLHDTKGNRPTTQININLPWRATGVKQVAGRTTRYGMRSKSEQEWLFSDNIPFDKSLGARVGGRMQDMGALVQGIENFKLAKDITDWNFENETVDQGIAEAQKIASGESRPVDEGEEPPAQPPAPNLGTGLAPGVGMKSEAEVRRVIEGVDTAGFPVRVVSADEAVQVAGTDRARGWGGFFNPDDGAIYLVQENLHRDPSMADSVRGVLREEVGHGLLRTEPGLRLLQELWVEAGRNLTEAEKEVLRAKGYGEERFLDEFIAKSIRENQPWWQRFVERVRTFLAKAGLVDLSNDEVARMILRQARSKVAKETELRRQRLEAANATLVAPGLVQIRPEMYPAIVAHHGTAHNVERFDISRIGTGQGAQVYGWGLYFAEHPEVAESYRRGLAGGAAKESYQYEGREAWEWQDRFERQHDYGRAMVWEDIQLHRPKSSILHHVEMALNSSDREGIRSLKLYVESLPDDLFAEERGNTYTVELKADPEEFLDWNKPFNEQSEKVKTAITPLLKRVFPRADESQFDGMRGERIYQAIESSFHGQVDPYTSSPARATSERMLQVGIPGIRYADQYSRMPVYEVRERPHWAAGNKPYEIVDNSKEGEVVGGADTKEEAVARANKLNAGARQTFNYVAFTDKIIEITDRNGKPVETPADLLPEGPSPAEPAMTPEEAARAEELRRNPRMGVTQVGGEKIGVRRPMENVELMQRRVRVGYFDGTQPVEADRTGYAWDLASQMTDPARKGAFASELAQQGGGAMAPGMLRNELWNYAVRMTLRGDPALLRFMTQRSQDFQTINPEDVGGGDTQAGRVLRAARDRASQALWTRLVRYTKEELNAAGRRLGVSEQGMNDIIEAIDNLVAEAGRDPEQLERDILVGDLPSIIDRLRPERQAATEVTDAATFVPPERRATILETVYQWMTREVDPERDQAAFTDTLNAELRNLRLTPEQAQTIAEATWNRKLTVDGEIRRRLWDRELRRLDNLAQKTAEQFLLRFTQAEWKKPDAPNRVRDIIKTALSKSPFSGSVDEIEQALIAAKIAPDLARPLAEVVRQPIGAEEGLFSTRLRDMFIAEGVSPEVARDLAGQVYTQRITNLINAQTKIRDRAAQSSNVRSLIEDILGTPYLAQTDPKWRQETARRWFESNGVAREQAIEAAKLFDAKFVDAMTLAAERAAERLLKKRANPRTIDDLVAAVRLGLTDPNKTWRGELASRAGFKPLPPEMHQKLAEFDQKLADPNLDRHQRVALVEKMVGIIRHYGDPEGRFMRTMAESFVASLLSGIRTMTLNIFQPIITLFANYASEAPFQPRDFITLTRMMYDSLRGLWPEARFAWQKDAYAMYSEEQVFYNNELKRMWEQAGKDWEDKKYPKAILEWAYAWQQYVIRGLQVADQAGMAVTREWKMALYGSHAMRLAGFNTKEISEMVDVSAGYRKAAYAEAIARGQTPNEAAVTADEAVIDALNKFFDRKVGTEQAQRINEAALYDAFSQVGRRAPGIKETDEGFISRYLGLNVVMKKVSEFRAEGGAPAILSILAVGFMNVPMRTARFYAGYSPYGLLRWGVDRYLGKYRAARGKDPLFGQTYANKLQADIRLRDAIVGTSLMLGFLAYHAYHQSSDPDIEKKKFAMYVTGNGPTNKTLRDSWLKRGFQPYCLSAAVDGKIVARIPITRAGQIFGYALGLAASADDVGWRRRQEAAAGHHRPEPAARELIAALGTYYDIIGAQGVLQSFSHLSQIGRGESGTGRAIAVSAASTAAALGIPGKSAITSLSQLLYGPVDRSSVEAATVANFPILNALYSGQAINRFGDVVGDQTWSAKLTNLGLPIVLRVADTPQNRQLYQTILDKGAAPPDLRRYIVEDKYGALTQDQWNKLAKLSGDKLKSIVTQNLNGLQGMDSRSVKLFMNSAAEGATSEAAAQLNLTPKPSERTPEGVSGGGRPAGTLPGTSSPVQTSALGAISGGPSAGGVTTGGGGGGFPRSRTGGIGLARGFRPRGARPVGGMSRGFRPQRPSRSRLRLVTGRLRVGRRTSFSPRRRISRITRGRPLRLRRISFKG